MKIKALTAIILTVFLYGCALYTLPEGQEIVYSNETARSEMSGFVDYFMSNFNQHGCKQSFKIEIMFYDNMDNDLLGFCRKRTLSHQNRVRYEGVITINTRRWYRLSNNAKQTLIAHELGHCVLGASHDESDPIMRTYHNTLDWSNPDTVRALNRLIKNNCQ